MVDKIKRYTVRWSERSAAVVVIYLLCIILASAYFKFTCFKCFYVCELGCLVLWIPHRLRTFSAPSSACPLSLWCLFSKASTALSTLKCCVLFLTLLHIVTSVRMLQLLAEELVCRDCCRLLCLDYLNVMDVLLQKAL